MNIYIFIVKRLISDDLDPKTPCYRQHRYEKATRVADTWESCVSTCVWVSRECVCKSNISSDN